MKYVYNLALCENTSDECEKFDIGIFSSREKAEETAERYLKEVSGFNNGSYRSVIKEMELLCTDGEIPEDTVYIIYGYNTDENGDTADIITSSCYSGDIDIDEDFTAMQRTYARSYWGVDEYIIDECQWAEGI